MRSCSGPARPARSAPGGSPTAASRSRSSNRIWSAASAPSTPACPRRRCCVPGSCSTRRGGCRACRRPSRASSTSRPSLRRRDEVIHDLDDSGQLPWLEEQGIELFRGEGRLDGERRVVGRRRHPDRARAVVVATGKLGGDPPDRRARRGRRLEQPRGDHREAGAAEPDRARRRAGGLRAGTGVAELRGRGHPGRRRRAASSPGGAVRGRAGRRRAS